MKLTDQMILPSEDGVERRFDVDLFIMHPSLEPAEITAALGLQARFQIRVGDPRKTPKGRPLPGNYPDTRWRHSVRYYVKDQWFAECVTKLVDRLTAHKDFFTDLRSTGGQASVIVQFLGDGYFGDQVPRETLGKLVELGLDLGIECFDVPQS